ncbi:hypothetical protein Taro_024094 [Colocasia esculenta]|uniref:Uncharacterized protein n=1 Tax=Colocasia esculenta TaxID=4460 RepID=A0A843VCP8_COLES|nr:hypothetical protein [Colocasia esculenta]
MSLVCSTGVGGCCRIRSTTRQAHLRRSPLSPPSLLLVSLLRSRDGGGRRGATQVVGARRGLSSRTRRLEERGKKGGLTTKPSKEELEGEGGGDGEGDASSSSSSSSSGAFVGSPGGEDAALPPMPDLPGLTPDFWEGSQWDAFGFFVQYLWAFGIVFALISGGIAVATYNEGATDFKQTPVYKESMQSRELLEEPDSSGSEVFEANPTEAASTAE